MIKSGSVIVGATVLLLTLSGCTTLSAEDAAKLDKAVADSGEALYTAKAAQTQAASAEAAAKEAQSSAAASAASARESAAAAQAAREAAERMTNRSMRK